MMVYKDYNVELDHSRYKIIVGRGLLSGFVAGQLAEKTKNKKVLLVSDIFFKESAARVLEKSLEQEGYEVTVYAMTAGKQNKTINEAIKLYELLENNGFSRDSTLIALGGGVVGDLAGFVASTYFRGMNFVTIPTTMMAMIDSSIGGKVAINFRKTINAIGNYYHPLVNIIDLDLIKSLSPRDFNSGLAEIIKCAVIADGDLFDYLRANAIKVLAQSEKELLHVMSRAIEIKLAHVQDDVRESGKRLKLNYGHTLGHAIESSTDVLGEVYRHGEGVAIGMVGAAFIAREYFGQNNEVLSEHQEMLLRYNLPTYVDAVKINFDAQQLAKDCLVNVQKDKKKLSGHLRFILPQKIGSCQVYDDVSISLVEKAFGYIIKGE